MAWERRRRSLGVFNKLYVGMAMNERNIKFKKRKKLNKQKFIFINSFLIITLEMKINK